MKLRSLFVYMLPLFLVGVTASVRVSAQDEALTEAPLDESVKEVDRSIVFESENEAPSFEAEKEPAVEVLKQEARGTGPRVIKRGDSLWDISEEYYNTPWRWREIWRANAYITNPDLIFPHDKLNIPGIGGQVSEAALPPEYEEEVEEEEYAEEEEYEEEIPPALSGFEDEIKGKYMEEGFVVPLDWEYDGYVIGSVEKKIMLSAGDLILLDIGTEDGLEAKVRCGIYRLGKKVRAKESRKVIGRIVRKIAIVEATVDVENNVSTARIISSSDYIKKGDYVRILGIK